VVEDSTSLENPQLLAKHGLCIFVEVKIDELQEVAIMMDTGPSPEVISHNINILNLDVNKIDAIVLSHGHYDHVGGLQELLKRISKQIPVVAHPKIFNPKFSYKPSLRYIGASFKQSNVETAAALLFASNPVTIAKGVMTTGEIERKVKFEKVDEFLTVEEGMFKQDIFQDDQALVVSLDGKGLVVISGCAHSGLINTIKHAQKITGVSNVYAVLGGFHLLKANEDRIEATIDELLKLNLKMVRPCHCTGHRAVNRLTGAFGERCVPIKTGDVVKIQS
jgi:7,8-dihydropterin-6-yl-methyl-4-(beta-D-ribofuranosyl)aminobenzene 5'-phosphate synthase